LRRANVLGSWQAVLNALEEMPDESALLSNLATHAARFSQRKTLDAWLETTRLVLEDIGMLTAFADDEAGRQIIDMLTALQKDCSHLGHAFSFAEWRALVCLQMESTDFIPAQTDDRVAMLPLNGARLRHFDAVLVVGADAEHLPSQPSETLFFGNAIRGELGLPTRESLQRQQLRDLAALMCSCNELVLSWQRQRDGESNAISPWLARLQLALERQGKHLAEVRVSLPMRELRFHPLSMPAPSAPQLLPKRLSASAYDKLVSCPYRFFAERMLGLMPLDELVDLPQKRD
jgi:ATP-dependent helicase/nuclease subunit B